MVAGLVLTLAVVLAMVVLGAWVLIRQDKRAIRSLNNELAALEQTHYRELEAMVAPHEPTVDPVALYQAIERLPRKVLETINGSINPQQGKVAELLAYAELRNDYDQVVPLGKPIDFIGFRYGPDPHIDFVEIKSGHSSLTPDERVIQAIVDWHNEGPKGLSEGEESPRRVRFRLIRVTDEAKRLLGGPVE